ALANPTTAAVIPISLGSLVFTPDTATAAAGDAPEFSFFPVNNSATMSDFSTPYTPAKVGRFHSGFFATSSRQNIFASPTSFRVVVDTTKPIFIYCGNPSHCQNRMSAVVNPNDSQTLEAYRLAASKAGHTIVPDNVFDGQLVAASVGS
ncbi:hypothetical protein B0T14DRAFT_399991, partial [Immersiella caudata]